MSFSNNIFQFKELNKKGNISAKAVFVEVANVLCGEKGFTVLDELEALTTDVVNHQLLVSPRMAPTFTTSCFSTH